MLLYIKTFNNFFLTELIYTNLDFINNCKFNSIELKIFLKELLRIDDPLIIKNFFILFILSGQKPTLIYDYSIKKNLFKLILKVNLRKFYYFKFLEVYYTFLIPTLIKKNQHLIFKLINNDIFLEIPNIINFYPFDNDIFLDNIILKIIFINKTYQQFKFNLNFLNFFSFFETEVTLEEDE